ncbi:unnamed protein product [Rotaria sp. Silwood1]|nr:unnamed protein product [Rotaria sp. Silwood1]CAF1581011.1 unnamed protein product [Rotaria sp. Silwood1]CAF1592938.1 unnamed protein product [Rotaria sp. Silwood1]CAF3737513.1 unnamed protein product [Rotaria sp. Silwood1]CAF4732334.1 unnamed protein product [Rotaria sp. Silwood1]
MACRALGKMGEKAPTTDVINRLVTALGDKNGYVRQCVCEVLGEMGEKAATNDVMNRLIAALGDENENVRQKASEALGEIGEKAATIDVITGLVTALGDENWNVSMSACDALGKMGEKAATNNVINGLVTALGNKIGHVRRRACEALGKIGEKAPNNDVINGLVTALWDADMSVRESACQVLGKMGEKAASNDVINGLLNARRRVIGYSSANEALEKILLSFSALTQLSSDTVSKLFENIKEGQLGALRTVPPDQFVKVFLHTRSTAWLPVVTVVALVQGNAVTVTGNTIMLYGSQESVQVPVPDEELRRELVEAFIHQTEELQSSSDLLAKSKVVSSVCILM